jgi:hypothetical protein
MQLIDISNETQGKEYLNRILSTLPRYNRKSLQNITTIAKIAAKMLNFPEEILVDAACQLANKTNNFAEQKNGLYETLRIYFEKQYTYEQMTQFIKQIQTKSDKYIGHTRSKLYMPSVNMLFKINYDLKTAELNPAVNTATYSKDLSMFLESVQSLQPQQRPNIPYDWLRKVQDLLRKFPPESAVELQLLYVTIFGANILGQTKSVQHIPFGQSSLLTVSQKKHNDVVTSLLPVQRNMFRDSTLYSYMVIPKNFTRNVLPSLYGPSTLSKVNTEDAIKMLVF